MMSAEEIEIVRLEAARRRHRNLTTQFPELKRRGDGVHPTRGDLVLQREHIFQCAIERLGPQRRILGRPNQLCGQTKALSRATDASFHDELYAELRGDRRE